MTRILDAAGGPAGESGNSAPWWVTATLRMGVPAALACFLVYYVTQNISYDLSVAKSDLAAVNATLVAHVKSTDQSMKEIQRLLGLQCVNSAKTQVDRASCFGQ